MPTRRVFLCPGEQLKYTKPTLSYVDQAQLLIDRGLVCDRDRLIGCLHSVNYYRLSGYLYPFRQPDDTYKPGTTLDKVWRRYTFDRRLRVLVLDAIERVEICIRTELVCQLAQTQDPFAYANPASLPGLKPVEHARFLKGLTDEYGRSKEVFVDHFKKKYGSDHLLPPLWMVTELMSFGGLFTLYRGSPPAVRKSIAARFDVNEKVLVSWLLTLNTVRNICAHHSRLWNREIGVAPLIPNKDLRWTAPVPVTGRRMFAVLSILAYLLDVVAPQSEWRGRVLDLFDRYPDVPLGSMGFPPDWEESAIWNVHRASLRFKLAVHQRRIKRMVARRLTTQRRSLAP